MREFEGSLFSGVILWMVAKPVRTTQEAMVETITFVGIYRGIILPGFLRWCRISSIHCIYNLVRVVSGNLSWFGQGDSAMVRTLGCFGLVGMVLHDLLWQMCGFN